MKKIQLKWILEKIFVMKKVYTKRSSNDHNQKLNKPNVTVQGKSSVVKK